MSKAVSGRTKVVGVFAYPVFHSLSPGMHNAAFGELGLDFTYVPFNVHPDNLQSAVQAIRALGMVGVNVTIPHKEPVTRFLDWISPEAKQIGSVNTVHNVDGVLKGYSTDGAGFIESLRAVGKSPSGSRAVVLGAGGSARAIVHALAGNGAGVTVANRTPARGVELVEALKPAPGTGMLRAVTLESEDAREAVAEADLLVNCTSVGMYPHTDEQPIPSGWLHKGLFVYDLVYNPLETMLLQSAWAAGCRAMNGVKMLVFQGAIAFEQWTGCQPPIETMEKAVLAGLQGAA